MERDTITKSYMFKPEYFVEAFHYYMFEGEQVVKADEEKAKKYEAKIVDNLN